MSIAQKGDFKLSSEAKSPLFVTAKGDTSNIGFVGGLYSAQFNNIDLNQDGISDLVIFDSKDGKILTFIGNGDKNNPMFEYAPDYESLIPQTNSWMLLKDFNADGKIDVFGGNGAGGIKVFKNITENGVLKFELYSQELLVFDTDLNFYLNVYVTPADIPAIVDIDFDGDLDVLSFDGGGGDVYYYRNYSVETYGHKDSFNFFVETYCFGMFRESNTSNDIVNLPCCYIDGNCKRGKHAGSNILMIDYQNDGDLDMLLSDVSYKTVNLLVNGKNPKSSNPYKKDTMVSIIKNYPNNTKAIEVDLFPGMTLADIDFDGAQDLLVTPSDFEFNLVTPNTWLYKNIGSNNNPKFEYVESDFIDGDGIDIGEFSNPSLFDIDADGDLDLFVTGPRPFVDAKYDEAYYRIAYYKNIGSKTKPIFKLENSNWMDFEAKKLQTMSINFGDVDGNGTIDLLVGKIDGKIDFYSNQNSPDKSASFTLKESNFQSIDAGAYAAPFLYDFDEDGQIDLFIGNAAGYVQFWQGDNGKFIKKTDSLGGIFVGNIVQEVIRLDGYAVPVVFKIPGYDKPHLFVGNIKGTVDLYENIDINQADFSKADKPFFNTITSSFENKILGNFSSIAVGLLTNDSIPDVLIGNERGGLYYFNGSLHTNVQDHQIAQSNVFDIYPNPTKNHFTLKISSIEANYNAKIYNLQGQLVKTVSDVSSNKIIDVSDFNSGLYIVALFVENELIGSKKLSIQP